MDIFQKISRGLFNQHKLIFSFLLAVSIEMQEKHTITQQDYNGFLYGTLADTPEYSYPPTARWSMKGWVQFTNLSVKMKSLQKISNSMQSKPEQWSEFFEQEDLRKAPMPMEEVKPFQRLLMVKLFREEKTIFQVEQYIEETLGAEYVHPPPVLLEKVFQDTTYDTPLIYILSSGADPLMNFMVRLFFVMVALRQNEQRAR